MLDTSLANQSQFDLILSGFAGFCEWCHSTLVIKKSSWLDLSRWFGLVKGELKGSSLVVFEVLERKYRKEKVVTF